MKYKCVALQLQVQVFMPNRNNSETYFETVFSELVSSLTFLSRLLCLLEKMQVIHMLPRVGNLKDKLVQSYEQKVMQYVHVCVRSMFRVTVIVEYAILVFIL